MKTLPVEEIGQALESEWWGEQDIYLLSDVLESRPRMSAHREFFLPDIYYYFVKGEAL